MTKKRILVIEDNPVNRKLMRVLIAMADLEVLEAAEAETGIALARERRPDLILMDIQLPGMDGLDATRVIKSDPDLEGIAVVAVTSFAMAGDEEKAREAGCSGYITKPINTRTFVTEISKYMAQGRD